jgi:hypothetical protein
MTHGQDRTNRRKQKAWALPRAHVGRPSDARAPRRAASPLPKVFSDVDGLETFASELTLRYQMPDGTLIETGITPELYGRLAGPYNRRNVYGAALSYAPRLPRELWEPVFCYGLRPEGPLRAELGLTSEVSDISVTIRTRTRGRSDAWTLESSCTQ